MKQKIFMLLAAVLLSSANLFAQSNEPLKGDVNEDGVVDVADVVAVIDIIAKSQNDSETTYYWYVGQTDPSTMSSIDPIVNDNSSPGWREIGTTVGTYSFSSPLWNSESNPISGSSNTYWYVAVPSTSSLSIYDSDDTNDVNAGNWTEQSTITVGNETSKVYKKVSTSRKFAAYWIH